MFITTFWRLRRYNNVFKFAALLLFCISFVAYFRSKRTEDFNRALIWGILPEHGHYGKDIGKGQPPKLILMMDSFFGNVFGQEMMGGCPDYNCKVISDRSQKSKSHALIFHGYSTSGDKDDQRRSWQRYIYFVQESPVHASVHGQNNNFYNWTFTYRRDSDIPSPYGYTVELSEPVPLDFDPVELAQTKKHLAAWFVSNCHANSMREDYVRLQRYVGVHIYGGCGNFSCPRSSGDECYQKVERDYKFYLAFENSICRDYITEKFWGMAHKKVVPIVLKRSIVEPYAPPNSFIAVDDFQSTKEMAEYLLRVDKDPHLYAKYFQWRRKFRILYMNGQQHDFKERPWGFCLICKRLWLEDGIHSTYENMLQWWDTDAHCSSELVKAQLEKTNKNAQKDEESAGHGKRNKRNSGESMKNPGILDTDELMGY